MGVGEVDMGIGGMGGVGRWRRVLRCLFRL